MVSSCSNQSCIYARAITQFLARTSLYALRAPRLKVTPLSHRWRAVTAKAPSPSKKRSAKAPKAASDEAEEEAPAPAPKRSSTASAPWGDVTKDEADVKVGGDDWASSSDDD